MAGKRKWILGFTLITACAGEAADDAADQQSPDGEGISIQGDQGEFQALSFTGDSLFSLVSEQTMSVQTPLLNEALAAWEADPADPDALIWVGRRKAYLGDYGAAIETFSEGIEQFPEDPRFYRHRGHRFLTTRQVDRAIDDFEAAAALIEGTEDRVEPDGLPNARGIPVSTLHFNIWYHLGLAHYLKGDYEAALRAYEHCLEASDNDDSVVATQYWLYMTLMHLGQREEAELALASVSPEMDIVENQAYHNLNLLFKGELTEEDVDPAGAESPAGAGTLFGIANWHRFNGREAEARATVDRLLALESQWASFGYIAAESERAREN